MQNPFILSSDTIVVASLFILVSIVNPIGETWACIWFGAIVEVVLLATVLRLARRWRAGRAYGRWLVH